ncbi:hypothetical protein [Pseudorhodoplanes sp.]|uniref:hypothetical protein n=1 Tax=Pseudorhodoplanes sp. TaxID=1934341 RepID=UPI00391CD59F
MSEFGHVIIVFDGCNDNAGADYIDAEKRIVTQFLQITPDSRVKVIDLIGRPMAESLIWIAQADLFISVYGAGLTKYRWICNKPGLALTGRWNLLHRGDLRIYHDPEFMEDPAPMLMPDPQDVEDVPDAKLLRHDILHPEASQMNFRMNTEAVLRHLRKLLKHQVPHSADRRNNPR